MQVLNEYQIHLKSLTPFVMHKDTLADPLHPLKKQMSQLTTLKKKQDEHYLAMSKLEWEAGLYYNDEIGLYLSSDMIAGCFKASAKKEKKGLDTKAIIIDCIPGTPLIGYEKETPESLWLKKNKKGEQIHVLKKSVNIQRSKTIRTWPILHSWEAKFNIFLDTEIMSEESLKTIIDRAGLYFGFGEMRPQLATGIYGKFKLEGMKKL